jgi:hypothetical protein
VAKAARQTKETLTPEEIADRATSLFGGAGVEERM